MINSMFCPCCSGKPYNECCELYHKNLNAPTAEALMRSRYCAYAKGLTSYIIATAHPNQFRDRPNFKNEIELFAKTTVFAGLEILSVEDGPEISFVTFFAKLLQNNRDVSFKERSRFVREHGRWFYIDGEIAFDPKEKS